MQDAGQGRKKPPHDITCKYLLINLLQIIYSISLFGLENQLLGTPNKKLPCLPAAFWHITKPLCHLTKGLWHTTKPLCNLTEDLWHTTKPLCYLTKSLWHMTEGLWHMKKPLRLAGTILFQDNRCS